MVAKEIYEAMGVSRPTYYKWKQSDDFPEEGSELEVFIKYAELRKQANHERGTAKELEPGSIRYKQEVAKLEKLIVDTDYKLLQLERGKQEILEDNYYEILDELSPFLKNLRDYIKDNENYTGVTLQSLIDQAIIKTEEQILARPKQDETKGE